MTEHPSTEILRCNDSFAVERRRAALDHVAGCSGCQERIAREDPTLLFALLDRLPIPQSALDDLQGRVEQAIDVGQAIGNDRRSPSRRVWSAAAVAASILLAALFAFQGSGPTGPPRAPEPTAAPASGLPFETARVNPSSDSIDSGLPARGVELISSSGRTQVVDLAVGETQVVMIFDKDLQL